MLKYKAHISFLIIILTSTTFFAQDNKRTKDTIDTQVVNVVKPYTPKISDAFKVKQIPSLDDENNTNRKEVKYNIFSIPVASTFIPSKGKAADVDKAKPVKLFDNYASFGVGSYTSVLGEIYLNHAINRTESVGGYLSHQSSQGGIDGLILDDKFFDTKVDVNYARKLRDYSWVVDAGARHQVFNWYGVPQPLFDSSNTAGIDPKHSYFTFDFGGKIEFEDRLLRNGKMRFRRFADDYDSGENRFMFSTNIDIPLRDEVLNTTLEFDYLGGTFQESFFANDNVNYGNFQIGIIPSYQLKQDDLTLDLGIAAYYLNDTENNKSKFYLYPKITASYRLVDELLITYGGIEGHLVQNSYYDFAGENPYLAPTLLIEPTDQQYDVFIGLKGKLSNNMSYNIKGKYVAENNKALFKSNPVLLGGSKNYQHGNSFQVVYDDVSTFSIFGELNVDVNRNFNLGIKAEYFIYDTKNQAESWNLPDFKSSLFLDYQFDAHWFAGANLYYVGERKDEAQVIDPFLPLTMETVALDSYFDANVHVGYRINERWSAYIKANNIANQAYNKWLNYPVQGIQFLAGATYKFDF